jgi:hypothetical protein
MKRFARLSAGMVALALIVVSTGSAFADAPVIQITSPTSATTVYVPTFPATLSINFTVSHSPLSGLNVLNVKVDDTSIFTDGQPIGNPFPSDVCSSSQMILPNISFCSASGTQATVYAPWTVGEPGTYAIVVSAKHTSAIGDDDEDVQVSLLAVEYPAPPAVANAYLKATYSKLKGGVHGCIISKIANEHAMNSKYGPKGGPYDEGLIKIDADANKVECGG